VFSDPTLNKVRLHIRTLTPLKYCFSESVLYTFHLGPRKARKAERYFGLAPGVPHSHTRARVRSRGRKFERARGRRNSRGYRA
jgi:hypothetical protein